ncbi:hypothetical protein ABZ656_57970 [Streptomyces sp. NPDC007095]|jgi:hypothetical protein|uniref:hypothetical protein n=1 Tax=Streptomyces sp. NPDC007095 TaxID=3154482 RepID=UPI000C6FE5B3
MANNARYRPTGADAAPGTPSPALTRGDVARTLLWILVVVSTVVNMAASYGEANTWVHLACGAVTVLCGGILVVRKLRGRR